MFATTAFAAPTDDSAYLGACNPVSCTQVADGVSYVQVFGQAGPALAKGGYMLISGGFFTNAAGNFSRDAGAPTAKVIIDTNAIVATSQVWVASSTAGTATITTYYFDANNVATMEGTFTLDFFAAGNLDISLANSLALTTENGTTTAKTSGPALPTNTDVADAHALLRDGNGAPVTTASVVMTILPLGALCGSVCGQTVPVAYTGNIAIGGVTYGQYRADVLALGVAGVSTISYTATYRGVTVSLPATQFTFTGTAASLTATGGASVANGGTAKVYVTAKDSSGNAASPAGAVAKSSNTALATVSALAQDADGYYTTVTCAASPAKGTADISFTLGTTITSNAVKVTCGAGAADKVVVSANTKTVAAGSTTAVAALVTDAGGLPVVDGTPVTALAAAGGVTGPTTTKNGVSSFAFVAPNTEGPVTVWAFSGSASGSLTFTVGTGSALVITNANKLDLPAAGGSYTTATPVAKFGQYVTWRGFAGTGLAGQTIGVEIATKDASGVWSSFSRLTSRQADDNGVVLFWWRFSEASWVSIRFVGPEGATSNAVQARWR